MVLTEAQFLKFLVQSSRIRAGLPDTVIGFNSSGKPQSVLKSSLGGVTRDPIATAFFEDEFVYNELLAVDNKYGLEGTTDPLMNSEVQQSNYGKLHLEAVAGTGNFIVLNTRRGFSIEDSADSMIVKFLMILQHDDIANNSSLFGFCNGYSNNNNGNTQASMMGATSDGFGYFVDINDNQNYKVWVNNQTGNGDSVQVIDTGVRASFGFPDTLEAEYTAVDRKVKFTLTADFPRTKTEFTITATQKLEEEMIMVAYLNAVNNGTVGIDLNYWSLESNRESTST